MANKVNEEAIQTHFGFWDKKRVMKQRFIFRQMRPVIIDFITQTEQYVCRLFFTRIQKSWLYDHANIWSSLRLISVNSLDCSFNSNIKWSVLTNPRKNSGLLLRIIAKHSRRCFIPFYFHLAHSFLISQLSVNMQCTILFQMSTLSVTSLTFSWPSFNTIWWIFLIICGVIRSLYLIDHCDVRLRSSHGLI